MAHSKGKRSLGLPRTANEEVRGEGLCGLCPLQRVSFNKIVENRVLTEPGESCRVPEHPSHRQEELCFQVSV